MDRVVPWQELCAFIELIYRKLDTGRPWAQADAADLFSCNCGSTFRTPRWRRRVLSRCRCGGFLAMISGGTPAPDETTVSEFRRLR
jgi:hypothetical protein